MAEPQLGQPFCGLSSAAISEQARGECKWLHSPVTVAHTMSLPAANITPAQISELFRRACAAWMSCCGIDLRFQDHPAANIIARVDAMDGPNGILGESYLPCGNVTAQSQTPQRYDTGESWTLSFLYRVILHEVGHALGLPHAIPPDAPPGTQSVMNPYLTAYEMPLAWEAGQLVNRYGPPRTPKPQPPVPLPPSPQPQPEPQPDPEGGDPIEERIVAVPSTITIPVLSRGSYVLRLRRTNSANKVRLSLTKR